VIANPPQQRAFRGPRPIRPGSRTAATGEHLARLAPRLTQRDRWLARMLYEHKVLTSHQIAALAWPTVRAANLRLLQLYRWRVIDRFQPYLTYGSAPMHYVLDTAGAAVLAHEDGLDLRDLRYTHDRALGIAHSLRLAHTVGTNGFFTQLIAHARQNSRDTALTTWWSEARCARHYGDIVRPDAYGRWQENGITTEWFLEYDLATERPDRVAAKLPGYAKLASTTGITTPLLIHLPTARREAAVRHALAPAHAALDRPVGLPVATTSAEHTTGDPAGPCWQLLDRALPQRLRLGELQSAWRLPPLTAANQLPAANELQPPHPMPPAASLRRPRGR
jgi:hypothetical protein